ncbi:MAG: hypothetical protein Q8O66_01300, partial [bacterium]|nr:hypothetical protein [bacterium]
STVYFFDMAGGFLAVIAVFLLYQFFISETIIILILLIVPLVGLFDIFYQRIIYKKIIFSFFLFFVIVGAVLFYEQLINDRYNLFGMIDCKNIEESPEGTSKIFCRNVKRVKSYDNLISRIDTTTFKDSSGVLNYSVSFDGWSNDFFNDKIISGEDDYFKSKEKEWPTLDIRVLYGAVDTPSILVIGSAAQGAIKTFKKITPSEKITPIEINPAILKMMQKDFFKESGKAYSGLNPILANGISFLKASDKKFDMITLLNAHSYRNIGHQGSPDYLHTSDTYNLFFNKLEELGYIMIEERPESLNAKLALYREINTLWQTLKDRGVENPSSHFVIWSWDKDQNYQKYSLNYFVGILVTKNPIDTKLMEPWIKQAQSRLDYFKLGYFNNYKGKVDGNEFVDLFKTIESNNFNQLEKENFDSSIATNNRPFLSQANKRNEKLDKLMLNIGILTFILWIIFTLSLLKGDKKKEKMVINIYNVLIGFAFFFIEIILFQVYQNIFLSSASSFVLVLGFLLFFAGTGGYLSEKIFFKKNIMPVFLFLIPLSVAVIYLPDYFLGAGFPAWFSKIIGLILISSMGFFMGFYFPRGLVFAEKFNLKDKTYYFFAINAVSGCFAVVLALYLGIKIGYIYTIILALIFYLLADIILLFFNRYVPISKK